MNIVLTSTAHASREMKHHHHDSHETGYLFGCPKRSILTILRDEGHHDKMGVSTQMTNPQSTKYYTLSTKPWVLLGGSLNFENTHTHISKRSTKIIQFFEENFMSQSLQLVVPCRFGTSRLPLNTCVVDV